MNINMTSVNYYSLNKNMLTKMVVSLVLLLVFIFFQGINSQCSVTLTTQVSVKDPVFLRNNAIWAPEGAALTWSAGESTQVACTGSGNSLTLNGQVLSTITCSSGNVFTVGGTSVTSLDLICVNTITGSITNTQVACSNSLGVLLNIGFNTGSSFVTYIQSCYSMVTGSTIWTRHVIPGKAIDYAMIESARPSFKSTGSAPHVSPATSYTQASQLSRLTTLLGSAAQAQKYIYTNSYMARGHFSPDADGIFRSWQFSTYFYTNVAPQWQVTNAGNWLRVENAARDISSSLQEDVLIYTGGHGILTLPHVNGQEVEITLEAGGNIVVPKWYWKIIKSPATNAAIALITLNNPFATSVTPLCTDICASAGWADSNYGNYSKGYTYCCTVDSFMAVEPGIPAEASASNLLMWQ